LLLPIRTLIGITPHKGEMARVLVHSPTWPAEGLVSVAKHGKIEVSRVTITAPAQIISVPLGPESYPGKRFVWAAPTCPP
jgi:hypothetical protein